MTTDDLAPRPEPSLFGFIKTKLPECLGGQPPNTEQEQPGLLSQQILTPGQITNLAQEGFANPKSEQEEQSATTYNPTLFTELEFYKSNDPTGQTPSIFDIISAPAQSITGREYLRQTTSRPTTDLEQLHSRQHTTQFLQQTLIAQEIPKILQTFKADESALYWLLDKKTPEMREVLDIIFFTKSWNRALNKNTGFITAYFYFIMIFNPLWGLAGPLVLLLIPFLVSRYLMNVPIPFSTYLDTLKSTLFGDKFFGMLIMGRQIFNTLSGGGTGNDDTNLNPSTRMRNALINKAFDLITSEFGRWLYLAVVLGGYLWTIYNQIVVSYNFNKLINFIHDRLNKYRRVIDNVKSIIRICDRTDHTGLRCPEFSQLAADCIKLINTHTVVQLIANDPVFLQAPGFFTNKGAIIKAFYQLELETTPPASQAIIRPFIRLMGYIDGWHSVAVLAGKVPKESGIIISTAKYDSASIRPMINLVEEYTPVCAKCVANSVNMGCASEMESGTETKLGQQTQGQTTEPNNILLTGPNGSGKSTFLKSVMTNIILAQTLGIAFAKEIRLTPFQYLSTYLNIPDCQGRESLFQAEMTRCHQHLELLRDLEHRSPRTGFSFNIMDEIFVSTNYLEGMSGAYAVIKHLGTLQNSCHIITTHFDKLTSASGHSNSIPGYANKYFRIDTVGDPLAENPEIHKDYLLRDGVNDRHLALHLLKLRGFNAELVQDAREMYSRLTSSIANDAPIESSNISLQETQLISEESQKDELRQILDEINGTEPSTEPSTEHIPDKENEKNNNTINTQE